MPIIPAVELEDYVGRALPPSEWFTLDQDRINQFADVTLDHQYIHTDPERAAQTPFGGTIAHGFLTLSLISYFSTQGAGIKLKDLKTGVNFGFDKVRFLAPVPAGQRVRAHFKLMEYSEKKPGQYLLKTRVSLEVEGIDNAAYIAQWLTMQTV